MEKLLRAVLSALGDPATDIGTLVAPITSEEERCASSVVKVACAFAVGQSVAQAFYFSRATIPFDRDATGYAGYRKHLGIYAYRRAALERFAELAPSPLEVTEKLEQLRLLENGMALYVAEAPRDTIGVDTEDDLRRAEAMLEQMQAR